MAEKGGQSDLNMTKRTVCRCKALQVSVSTESFDKGFHSSSACCVWEHFLLFAQNWKFITYLTTASFALQGKVSNPSLGILTKMRNR